MRYNARSQLIHVNLRLSKNSASKVAIARPRHRAVSRSGKFRAAAAARSNEIVHVYFAVGSGWLETVVRVLSKGITFSPTYHDLVAPKVPSPLSECQKLQ